MKKILLIWVVSMLFFSNFLILNNNIKAESLELNISLQEGWNLITIPIENDMMASDLLDIIDGCLSVSGWDAANGTYLTYLHGWPDFDFPIEDGMGYFVDIENDTTLTISGERLSDVSIDLLEYNLLGWYKSQSSTASEIMNSIVGCTQVKGWNPSTQKDIYYNSSSDPDFTISQGDGYWVKIDGGFEFNLKAGWNLITIPVENDMMASDLAEDISGCLSISKWDAAENTYYGYIVGGPLEFDFQIEDGYGLFVDVESASTFTVAGERLSDVSIDLLEYNLLGWYKSQSSTASEIMNSIVGCTQVKGWNPSTQKDIYYNSSSDPDFTISQGDGYWVKHESPKPLTISTLSSIDEGQIFQVTITYEGTPIEMVLVTFVGYSYYTDADGKVSLSAPLVLEDVVYTISASKTGYISDDFYITITNEEIQLPELTITASSTVEEEQSFSVTVKSGETTIEGALVTFLENQYSTNANGIVSLSAPSVLEDAVYTISASKTGYSSDTFQITVKNRVVVNDELVISVPSTVNEKDSFIVDVTYEDSAVQDALVYFSDSIYTTNSEGKVTLTAPMVTTDTTYSVTAEKTGYISSGTSVFVRNTIISNGVIYGSVLKEAKICVCVSESGVTKNKCTYADKNGNYNVSVKPGIYILTVSKTGYITATIENIEVLENGQVNVDIILEEGLDENLESFADYTIEEEIKKGKIFGKVDPDNKIVTTYGNVSIELTSDDLSGEGIGITVSGEGVPGTKIVVYLGEIEDLNSLVVKYDGETIQRTKNIVSFFNDTNDRSEWILTLIEEDGITEYILIVNVPHFSEHTITILSTFVEEIVEKVMIYKEIAISAAIIFIVVAAIFMFKKSKEEY